MCGRYTVAKTPDDLADYFDAEFDESGAERLVPAYNASPGQHLPVIANDAPGRIRSMLWGMTRAVNEVNEEGSRVSRLLINARSESVDSRPAFRESFRRRRCLVIADGFYEWKATFDRKQPYRIVLVSREPFAFAGVWEESHSGDRHFVILTTAADPVIRPIHDRMPVVLPRSGHAVWLDHGECGGERVVVERITHPDARPRFEAYAVSSDVNASRANHPGLIEPAREPAAPSASSLFD